MSVRTMLSQHSYNSIDSVCMPILVAFICFIMNSYQMVGYAWSEERVLLSRHSVKPPFKPASGIRLWNSHGSTQVHPEKIRLSDKAHQTGSLWHSLPLISPNWEVEVEMNVSKVSGHKNGDGWAFFYTETKRHGSLFGTVQGFIGLSVIVKTHRLRANSNSYLPIVQAHIFNGTQEYDFSTEGMLNQVAMCEENMLPCQFQKVPSRIRVRYQSEALTVWVDRGVEDWSSCFRVENVFLPQGYYLGAGALTGELASVHDLLTLRTYEIDGPEPTQLKTSPSVEPLQLFQENPYLIWIPYKIGSLAPECAVDLAYGFCPNGIGSCPMALLRIEDNGRVLAAALSLRSKDSVIAIGEMTALRYKTRSRVHAQVLCHRASRDVFLSWKEFSSDNLEYALAQDRLVTFGRSIEGDLIYVCRARVPIEPSTAQIKDKHESARLGVFSVSSGQCRFVVDDPRSKEAFVKDTQFFEMLLTPSRTSS